MKSNFRRMAISMMVFSLLLSSATVFAAEAVTYIGTNGKITTSKDAVYMYRTSFSKKSHTVDTYMQEKDDWKKMITEQYKRVNDSTYEIKATGENVPGTVVRTYKKQMNGSWKFRDKIKGHLVRAGFAKSVMPLLLQGEVTEYYANGNIKSKAVYKDNELLSNENWLADGQKYIDNIFYSVDSVATFNPGEKVLHQHVLAALKDAKIDANNLQGSVVIGFVVMENGKIDGIRVLKGLGPKVNNVVYQSIFTLPLKGNWTPARLNGQAVRYFQVFPVNFKSDYRSITYSKVLHDYMEWDRKW